jgi:SAM-dependent methyltransferase
MVLQTRYALEATLVAMAGASSGPAIAGVFMYQVEHWLTSDQVEDLAYSDYWNDEDSERSKAWYILDGDFTKYEKYLQESGLVEGFNRCVELAERLGCPISGIGADVAAGVLWAVPLLLSQGAVRKIYCVEYSSHRLLKIGPRVLEQYNVSPENVVLCLGSFYDFRIPDAALDFILLSTAFHHADEPYRLLAELRRVLKPGSPILVMGEAELATFSWNIAVKRVVKSVVALLPSWAQKGLFGREIRRNEPLFRPKPAPSPDEQLMGDHYYTRPQYLKMFRDSGFQVHMVDEQIADGCILIHEGSFGRPD